MGATMAAADEKVAMTKAQIQIEIAQANVELSEQRAKVMERRRVLQSELDKVTDEIRVMQARGNLRMMLLQNELKAAKA